MEHNLPLYRSELLHSKVYAASPRFLPTLGWHVKKAGEVLVNWDPGDNVMVSVVSHILERRLDCGPTGNYKKWLYGGLETAKFHLLLGNPTGTPFADNFKKVVADL